MKLIADALISLPFTLDFCSQGPDVEPLTCRLSETDVTLFFPPSLSEGTDGQGIMDGWAWWTGKTLRLVLEREVDSADDVRGLRETMLTTGNEVLRRFLNAYRTKFNAPAVHPVPIGRRSLELRVVYDDGTAEELLGGVGYFHGFLSSSGAPVHKAVSEATLPYLRGDVENGTEPSVTTQLRLDAQELQAQGEQERADLLLRLSQEPELIAYLRTKRSP